MPERAKQAKERLRGLFRQLPRRPVGDRDRGGECGGGAGRRRPLLRSTNLPLRVRVGEDAYLEALAWSSEPALERRKGPAAGDDEVGLSHATAAVAETGTLVLASGADNPVTLTYLPETHIVVVEDKDLVGGYEGAWDKLRARFGRARHAAHRQLRLGPLPHRRHRRATGDGRPRAAPAVRDLGAG